MSKANAKAYIGLAIMAFSLGGFFWYGLTFHVFGGKIKLGLTDIGFFCWLVFGFFGLGYTLGGTLNGIKLAGGFTALIVLAIGIGVALGHYR